MSPVLLITGWVVFLVLDQLAINERARQGTVRMGLVEETQRILADFVVDVAHLSAQTSSMFREDTARKTRESERQTLELLNYMVFGGPVETSSGTVQLGRVEGGTYEDSLLLGNACSPLADLPLEDLRLYVGTPNSTAEEMASLYAKCRTIDNGILTGGTYGAILSIVTDARRLEINRPRPDTNTTIFTPARIALHTHMALLEAPFVRLALDQTSVAVGDHLSSLIE